MRKEYFLAVLVLLTLSLTSPEAPAQQSGNSKIEVGGFLSTIDLNSSVGEKPLGVGGRLTYNLNDHVAVDGEYAYYPENPSGNFGQTVALAGIRAGLRNENFGIFAKVRPGVVRFAGDFFRRYNNSNHNNLAIDVGGVLEFYPSARVIARIDLGDTIIPFGDEIIAGPLPPYMIRPATTHNFQGSFGVGFRF